MGSWGGTREHRCLFSVMVDCFHFQKTVLAILFAQKIRLADSAPFAVSD